MFEKRKNVGAGGKTPTHALLTGSPAANKGNNCVLTNTCALPVSTGALVFHQRGTGFPRQFGLTVIDIGAVESDLLAPTAANVSVAGRVLTANGSGIRGAVVTLTDLNANTLTGQIGTFGSYRLQGVEAGKTYVVSVVSKRFVFDQSVRILTVNDDLADVDFIAQE